MSSIQEYKFVFRLRFNIFIVFRVILAPRVGKGGLFCRRGRRRRRRIFRSRKRAFKYWRVRSGCLVARGCDLARYRERRRASARDARAACRRGGHVGSGDSHVCEPAMTVDTADGDGFRRQPGVLRRLRHGDARRAIVAAAAVRHQLYRIFHRVAPVA